MAIRDIYPQAQTHALVLPRKHIASLAEAFPEDGQGEAALMGEMLGVGAQVARKLGLLPDGFRSVINTNIHAGQTVFHIHLHILGGEPLGHFGS